MLIDEPTHLPPPLPHLHSYLHSTPRSTPRSSPPFLPHPPNPTSTATATPTYSQVSAMKNSYEVLEREGWEKWGGGIGCLMVMSDISHYILC